MAVGRDGRPEAETLLWETSAKLHAEKPAAGSAAAVVTERRRASPGPAKVPVAPSGAPRSRPRATGSEHVPCVPAAPPRHPARPSARGTRLSVARGVVAAPKIPAAPSRASERTASPRVRAMAALAESARAQAVSASNSAVSTSPATAREAPVSVAPASVGSARTARCPSVTSSSASAATASVAAAPPSVAPAVAAARPSPAAPQTCSVQPELAPSDVREALVRLEDPSIIKSPIKTPTKAGPPTLDDRPVATPTNSMRPCLIHASVAMPTRSDCVAEMWLRLARIAMLELTKLPPCASIVGKPFERAPYNEPSKSLEVRLQREYEAAQREAGTQGEVDETQREADDTQRDGDETCREADETRREADENHTDADETRRHADQTHQEADASGGFGVLQPQALDDPYPEATDRACPRECDEGTPQRSCDPNPWMSMAFPEQADSDDEHGPVPAPCNEEGRAIQGWTRILMRVFSVTMGGPGPPPGPEYDADDDTHYQQDVTLDEDAEEGTQLELPPGACDGEEPREGCKNVCLGELMEESVSWCDVDSDDDCHSPKEADQMRAMQEAEEEAVEMPRGMKDVYRQQNAPGIVAGMQKCLSFF